MAKKATSKSRRSTAKSDTAKSREEKTERRESASKRPLWTGTLRLALVSVPIKLYAATYSGARIAFHQVHKPSGKRIRYQKVAPGIGPLDTDEIVKGFELESGEYVLLEPEEIEDLKLEAKQTLDIVQFVEQGEVDPIWFYRPYYVVADGEVAEEGYRVLRDAMRETGRLGLGQFVMRGREYIAAIKPCGNGLMLETLRFTDEVYDAAPYFAGVEDEAPDEELLELAEDLIERKSAPFEPQRFRDHYTEALRDLIEAKAKDRKRVEVEEEGKPRGGQVIDLVDALKRSVKEGQQSKKSSGGTSRSRKRKAG